MSWRSLAILLGVGVFGLGLVFLLAGEPTPSQPLAPLPGPRVEPAPVGSRVAELSPPAPAPGSPEVAPAASPVPPPAEEPPGEAPVQEELPASDEEPPAETPDPADEVLIHGSVVVRDSQGNEHRGESGTLTALLWSERIGRHRKIEVRDGTFEVRVPAGVALGVGRLELGGRPAVAEESERRPIPADGRWEIVARWPTASVLRVRAADTGAELTGLTILGNFAWRQARAEYPGEYGDEQVLLRNVNSPVTLPPPPKRSLRSSRKQVFYACAEGYAWGRIEIDMSRGGERVLSLEHAGGLDLSVSGYDPANSPLLRLRSLEKRRGRPLVELALVDQEEVALDALLPGGYRVTIEIGDWWEKPLVLGRTQVEIRVGERAQGRIEAEPAPTMSMVPLAGSVVIPAAWEVEGFIFSVELLDTPLAGQKTHQRLASSSMEQVPGRPGVFNWRLEAVQPGRYELGLRDPAYSVSVEVGPEGKEDALLELPPPAEVEVTVLDAGGAPAKLERINWHPERPRWVSGGSLERATRDPETGLYRFRAPQGRIQLSVGGDGYRTVRETLEVGPGHNPLTLRLERAQGFLLVVMDGETRLPWSSNWHVSARAVEGEGRANRWSTSAKGKQISVTEPGVYRLDLSDLDLASYEPIPEQLVTVEPGRYVEHVIRLIRKP